MFVRVLIRRGIVIVVIGPRIDVGSDFLERSQDVIKFSIGHGRVQRQTYPSGLIGQKAVIQDGSGLYVAEASGLATQEVGNRAISQMGDVSSVSAV